MSLELAKPKELPLATPPRRFHGPELESTVERKHARFLTTGRSRDGRSSFKPSRPLVLALLAAVGVWAAQSLYKPLALGNAEDRLLVRASDVVNAWGGQQPTQAGERFDGGVRVDGRASLDYFYDPDPADGLRIECSVQRFPTRAQAEAYHALAEVRLMFDWGLDRKGRVGLVEQMAELRAGAYGLTDKDEVLAYRVQYDGEAIGQALVVRIGNDTYDLAIKGPVAHDAIAFAELVGPRLLELRSWQPAD